MSTSFQERILVGSVVDRRSVNTVCALATHDTRLRFALGRIDTAHHFESETFAREEGDRLCQEIMAEAHAMHRPLVLVAVTSPDSGVCEIVSGITGASYGYLRATNHQKGNQ